MRKIIIVTILTCMMALSGAATAYATNFTDVGSRHWAYAAVNVMSDKTIIKGYPNGSFQPSNTITYGEFIKMALIAATGKDAGNSATGNWALNYYNEALKQNYFTEYDIDRTDLNKQITRAHMALIISSILGDVKIDDYDKIQQGIADIKYKTPYEYDITKSYASGILTGYTDNTFRPEKTLSRAEAATVIYRLVDESKRVLPGIDEILEDSTVKTYPTSGLLDMLKLTPDKIGTKSAHFTDTYELYTDASVWDIKLHRAFDGEDCSFEHTLKGFIYLVKDGVIMDYCRTTPRYDENGNYLGYQGSISKYDITKADYIMAVPTIANDDATQLIKVVVNPFKSQKVGESL